MNSPLIQEDGDSKVLKLRFDVSQYTPEEIVVKTVDQKLLVSMSHSTSNNKKISDLISLCRSTQNTKKSPTQRAYTGNITVNFYCQRVWILNQFVHHWAKTVSWLSTHPCRQPSQTKNWSQLHTIKSKSKKKKCLKKKVPAKILFYYFYRLNDNYIRLSLNKSSCAI